MAKRQPLARPLPIGDILLGLMKPLDWESLAQRSRIRQVWEAVVPPEILPHTLLLELRRRELWVEVSAAAWGQELQFLGPGILAALERALGPGVIRNLRIRVGQGVKELKEEQDC
ncbi:MAG: DciA family protein [Desulfobaccales bacterium]